ncbi:TetR/AcrR family transcriptional regulator [Nocardia sp. alder85J]|uniref:TetR/AcrR family transcriptional regulator n=1 Tax=Nocardia sp. alder85J TaxID=2862949 RepID=UPI001CD68521|nr:TetR/AcrR family transcriptional regulator [Nocardia sp. alder85J]MCX4094208.1 TetR/AcrR family transcriptional regulator [Nocardia sp. alder85J]
MARVTRNYGGLSAEQRRGERRARILDAGLDVVGRDGMSAMTMTAVCGAAGLTERYFYESFANLDALRRAVVDELLAEVTGVIMAALTTEPPQLRVRCKAAATAMFEVLAADPRKARTFREASSREDLQQLRDTVLQGFAAVLAEQMAELAGLGDPRLRPRLIAATTMLVGGLAETISAYLGGSLPVPPEVFIDTAAQLCVDAATGLGGL